MTQAPSEVSIREAGHGDVKTVAELCARTGHPRWNLAGLLDDADRCVLVAVRGKRVVGIAKAHWHPQADGPAPAGHYLGGVLVDPQARRQGVGAALTARRLDWIWRRARYAYYFTTASNTASINLHRRFDFHCLGAHDTIRAVSADDGVSQLLLYRAENPEQPRLLQGMGHQE